MMEIEFLYITSSPKIEDWSPTLGYLLFGNMMIKQSMELGACLVSVVDYD